MDRRKWLAERREAVERDYTRDPPTYDDGYDPVPLRGHGPRTTPRPAPRRSSL